MRVGHKRGGAIVVDELEPGWQLKHNVVFLQEAQEADLTQRRKDRKEDLIPYSVFAPLREPIWSIA
jgi:hypothetical protein